MMGGHAIIKEISNVSNTTGRSKSGPPLDMRVSKSTVIKDVERIWV
tara:strand:- start:196 stop:333 length:138 start_codon:yes stop_codon:yes gene_type:complete